MFANQNAKHTSSHAEMEHGILNWHASNDVLSPCGLSRQPKVMEMVDIDPDAEQLTIAVQHHKKFFWCEHWIWISNSLILYCFATTVTQLIASKSFVFLASPVKPNKADLGFRCCRPLDQDGPRSPPFRLPKLQQRQSLSNVSVWHFSADLALRYYHRHNQDGPMSRHSCLPELQQKRGM